MRIVGQAERTTDIVSAEYQTVNRERAACIIIVTDLDVELDFRPNGQLVAAVQEAPGQWNVYVSPFERRIDVYAFGYEPLTVILREFGISNLQSNDVYRLRLTGDRIDGGSIENIYIAVQVTPSNASVYLNDTKVEDSMQILAKVGKNSLRIEHPGYKTITEEIDVSEQRPTFFQYRMELEAEVPIQINTNPSGANVSIDNLSMGSSPVRAFFSSGRHRIRIVKEGYKEIDDWIEIEDPSTAKIYNLEDIRGALTIKTNPISSIYINDQLHPEGVSNLKLSPQLVRIRIVTPKADDINRNIAIRERENLVLELFPVLQTATVRIDVIPVDADVLLTGDEGEKYSSKGGTTFEDVTVGRYELIVSAEGHKTHRESFEVNKDDVVRKQVILEEGSDLGRTPRFVNYEEPPQVVKRVPPEYPRFARLSGMQGSVVLDLELFRDGTVGAVEVVQSLQSGPGGLDEAAIKAVKQWVFTPAKSDGKSVAVWVRIPINFRLD